jgi:hypothetical protein
MTTGASEFVTLEEEWINQNLSLPFQQFLKDQRDKQKEGYVAIPEGANDKHEDGTVKYLNNAPVAKYWQSEDNKETRKCLFFSIASALNYLGHSSLAFRIGSARCGQDIQGWDFVGNMMKTRSAKEQQLFKYRRLTNVELLEWNLFKDAPKFHLCALGVMSSDGKTDHAIAIVNKWIFDANFERGLPLTVKSLNLCCSSSGRPTTFVKVTRGYVLEDRK